MSQFPQTTREQVIARMLESDDSIDTQAELKKVVKVTFEGVTYVVNKIDAYDRNTLIKLPCEKVVQVHGWTDTLIPRPISVVEITDPTAEDLENFCTEAVAA